MYCKPSKTSPATGGGQDRMPTRPITATAHNKGAISEVLALGTAFTAKRLMRPGRAFPIHLYDFGTTRQASVNALYALTILQCFFLCRLLAFRQTAHAACANAFLSVRRCAVMQPVCPTPFQKHTRSSNESPRNRRLLCSCNTLQSLTGVLPLRQPHALTQTTP